MVKDKQNYAALTILNIGKDKDDTFHSKIASNDEMIVTNIEIMDATSAPLGTQVAEEQQQQQQLHVVRIRLQILCLFSPFLGKQRNMHKDCKLDPQEAE